MSQILGVVWFYFLAVAVAASILHAAEEKPWWDAFKSAAAFITIIIAFLFAVLIGIFLLINPQVPAAALVK